MQTYCGAQHVRLLMPLPQHTSARKYINMEKSEQIENVWKWIKWSLIELSRLHSIPRFFFLKSCSLFGKLRLDWTDFDGIIHLENFTNILAEIYGIHRMFRIFRKYKFCQAIYFAWHGTRFPPVPKKNNKLKCFESFFANWTLVRFFRNGIFQW